MSMLAGLRRFFRPPPAPEEAIEQRVREALQAGFEEGRISARLDEQWTQPYAQFDQGWADTRIKETPERSAYRNEPLMAAAVQVMVDLTLGTGVAYGKLDDEAAYEALEEWYQLNQLGEFSRQMLQQWLLDGELLVLLATNGSRNAPAWLNLWDTKTEGVTLNLEEGNPRVIRSVRVGGRDVGPEGFAWRANDPLWNTQRGTSPLRTAVKPACAYTRLVVDLRPRAHEIRGRLNAVYYALARDLKELELKAGRYRNMPKHGNVVTLQMNPETGQSEKLELLSTRTDAADAEADMRALVRTVAMVAGVPEHFLAIGDTGNRATADAMAEPMIRRTEVRQAFVIELLSELFRKELKRRFGPSRLYRVESIETEGLERRRVTRYVTADELEIPFSLPPVRSEDGRELTTVQYALGEGLISRQTAQEDLGYDPALEAERLGSEGGGGDGEPGAAFGEDAENQARILNAARLAAEANAKDPSVGLHWAHIITAPGAATAPGAYLAAAMGTGSMPATDPQPEPSEQEGEPDDEGEGGQDE